MNTSITPPEHANNAPLGILLNSVPFPDGHGLNTVVAAIKRVKLAESGWTNNTSEDVAEEIIFVHKVIERHIYGGLVAPPVKNAHLMAQAQIEDKIVAACKRDGAIANAIIVRIAAAFRGSIAAGVPTVGIAAACEPSGDIADFIAADVVGRIAAACDKGAIADAIDDAIRRSRMDGSTPVTSSQVKVPDSIHDKILVLE
jgi:hypothetical protein